MQWNYTSRAGRNLYGGDEISLAPFNKNVWLLGKGEERGASHIQRNKIHCQPEDLGKRRKTPAYPVHKMGKLTWIY